jgi:hypothetical protein
MERMRLWMAGYTEGDGAAVEVLLVDNQGKIILSSMPERNGVNVQAAPWFKMSQAQPCIYGPVVAEGRKTPTLTFAAPVFDGKTGQPLGRVAVAQPLSELNEICIDRTGLGATGETYILDRAGYMLTPSRFDTSSAPLLAQGGYLHPAHRRRLVRAI